MGKTTLWRFVMRFMKFWDMPKFSEHKKYKADELAMCSVVLKLWKDDINTILFRIKFQCNKFERDVAEKKRLRAHTCLYMTQFSSFATNVHSRGNFEEIK
jgi:hypothetical protein